jgi:hypothetical protein
MIGRLDSGGENKHIQKVFNMSRKYYKGSTIRVVKSMLLETWILIGIIFFLLQPVPQ